MIVDWLLLLGVAATWGSLFLLVKKALIYYTAWEVTGIRYVLCLFLLAPFSVRAIRSITRQTALPLGAVAIFGTGLPVLLLTLGQQQINSATTAIINALTPLFALLLGRFLFGTRLKLLQLAGIVIGFSGVVILSFARNGLELSIHPIFALLAISATVSYGWTANYLRAKLPFVAAIDVTTVTYIVTGVLSALLLVAWPGFLSKVAATPIVPSVAYLVAMSLCSVLILLGYYKLIHRRGVLFGATVTYLTPGIAFGWGIIDAEPLGVLHAAGLAVILTGVVIANLGRTRAAPISSSADPQLHLAADAPQAARR
jgi:drug/metabolite transporter (DMT)-like permease